MSFPSSSGMSLYRELTSSVARIKLSEFACSQYIDEVVRMIACCCSFISFLKVNFAVAF